MPTPTDTASGLTFGRYRLLEVIGRGGMAEVFKAKSFGVEGFEKVLVIKRIVPALAKHSRFVEMFVQEAKLAVRLSHANIVQVFDLGRLEQNEGDAPCYFIAMEYVPGVDLNTLMRHLRSQDEQLPFGAISFIGAEIAKALDHAHRRRDERGQQLNIVHRDISPHNILLSWDGDVKVTDFGIAKAVDSISDEQQTGELEAVRATGKIAFMSPEQTRADAVDAQSDLFSMGTMLYQTITGANPFTAPTVSETVRRIQAGEYPPLQLARPDTPAALCTIVGSLLQVEPNDRLQGAATLCEQLLAYRYTSGDRFGITDLAKLLTPLRKQPPPTTAEPTTMFDDSVAVNERTPVEVPHPSTPPPAPLTTATLGERREVTALLLLLGDEAVHSAELTARVRDILDRHAAWIEKESSTHITAIFGLSEADGRDAEAAVRAALLLVRERRWGLIPSAGIHSAAITVDDGGIPIADELLSGLLNTAQSLARATVGHVVLSPLTKRLVRRHFLVEPLPQSERAVTDGGFIVRSASPPESQNRFLGRQDALRNLGTILAAATHRNPQLVVLQGNTGIGKTRLLAEAKRRLERGQFKVAMYTANCPPHGTTVPWSGLRAMLHVLCGTQDDDAPQRIVEVRPRLRALGLDDSQTEAVLSLLGAPTRTRASELKSIIRSSFVRMVRSLCRDSLHCFAWDDAHTIDEDSLDAIRRASSNRGRLRATFILAQQGELPSSLTRRKDLHVITLQDLDAQDSKRLIESQLDVRAVPQSLASYVHDCAGGHPLFVEELVRELADTTIIQVFGERVDFAAHPHPSTPRTLRAIIGDRVSRLRQKHRRVLQSIAILGEPAFTPILAAMLNKRQPVLDHVLSELGGAGLLRRTGPTQVRFVSPLYQEIILAAIPSSLHQQLHAGAAKAYEDFPLAGAGENADRMAHHCLRATMHDKAVHYFWQSAAHKLDLGQLEPALRAMLSGLSFSDPSTQEIETLSDWLEKIANTLSQVRSASGLKEIVADTLKEIQKRGSMRQRVLAHIHVSRALGSINLFHEAYEALENSGAAELDDDVLLSAQLVAEAELANRQGLFVRAVAACDRLETLGPHSDAETLMTMAVARATHGQCELAYALLNRVDKLAPAKDDVEQASRLKHRILVHFNARDFAAAASSSNDLATLARAAGLRFESAAALHNLADAADRLGEHPRAYAALVESLELSRALEIDRLTNLNLMHLCVLDSLRGDEAAEEELKGLIRQADARGFLWDVLEGRFLLARILVARNAHDLAREHAEQVISMARDQGHRLLGEDAQLLLDELPPPS